MDLILVTVFDDVVLGRAAVTIGKPLVWIIRLALFTRSRGPEIRFVIPNVKELASSQSA